MATYSKANINNLRNTNTKMQKDIGNVYQYTGIYEAVVISAKDVQKNGRLTVRLVSHNVNIDFLNDDAKK